MVIQTSKQWVYFFGEKNAESITPDKQLLGGKGAGLLAMSQAGFPVPPGFTITTETCSAFFDNGNKWVDGLYDQIKDNLEKLEKLTGRTFGKGSKPLLVSVRSGAAVSMPGMMDTILNCGINRNLADDLGDTPEFWKVYLQFVTMFSKCIGGVTLREFEKETGKTEKDATRETADLYIKYYEKRIGRKFPHDPWDALKECIDMVFDSWHSERAIAYRKQNDLRGVTGTAVNVQSMFPSDISGILFTQDPGDLKANQIVIEGSYGLGEAIVSGDVTPDRFIVSRDDCSLTKSYLGNKSEMVYALGSTINADQEALCLNDEQIVELSKLSLSIEEYFEGVPIDIEWGWADGKFGLLQSRPIRGLEITEDVEVGRIEEIARIKMLSKGKRSVWVAHNLSETLPAPTPLSWDIVKHFMSGSGGFGMLYKDLGYKPSKKVCEDGFLELICGRIYADPDRVAQLFWEGLPMTYDLQAIIKDKSLLEAAPNKFDAEKTEPDFLFKFPGLLYAMYKCSKKTAKAKASAKEIFDQTILPPYLAYLEKKRSQDLTLLTVSEIISECKDRIKNILDDFGKESLKPGFFGGMALSGVHQMLVQLMGEQEGAQLARTLCMGLEDTTTEQNIMIYDVATGHKTLKELLEKFGHRTVGEMELSTERWRENSSGLETMINGLKNANRSPREMHDENKGKQRAAEGSLKETLEEFGGSCFYEGLKSDLDMARELLPYREIGKHYLMMGYEMIRMTILELSNRFDLGRDIFFLELFELEKYESDKIKYDELIAKRKIRWQSAKRLDMPDVIDSAFIKNLGNAIVYESSEELSGDAVSAGISTGIARIVFNPGEAGDIGVDYILVCPSTDPAWTSLFINAKGLVIEKGGVLSHGSIVARDFGIPAVVCPNVTSRIKDGQMVRVDGNTGKISIIEGDQ